MRVKSSMAVANLFISQHEVGSVQLTKSAEANACNRKTREKKKKKPQRVSRALLHYIVVQQRLSLGTLSIPKSTEQPNKILRPWANYMLTRKPTSLKWLCLDDGRYESQTEESSENTSIKIFLTIWKTSVILSSFTHVTCTKT